MLGLASKLLTVSHLASLAPHQRNLLLLFQHVSSLARYDAIYEVRDRSRFLQSLLASGGIGTVTSDSMTSTSTMGLAEFSRGEEATSASNLHINGNGDDDQARRTLTGEQVRSVMFDRNYARDWSAAEAATGKALCLDIPSCRLIQNALGSGFESAGYRHLGRRQTHCRMGFSPRLDHVTL